MQKVPLLGITYFLRRTLPTSLASFLLYEEMSLQTQQQSMQVFCELQIYLIVFCLYKGTVSIQPSTGEAYRFSSANVELDPKYIPLWISLAEILQLKIKIDKPFGWASMYFRHKYALPFGWRIFFIRWALHCQVNNINLLLVYLTGHCHRTWFANNTGTWRRK